MQLVVQSTAVAVSFFASDDNGDPVADVPDGSWTKLLSKAGGVLSSMTVTVTYDRNGWYRLTLSTSHTDTLGQLVMVLTASGVKQVNRMFMVDNSNVSNRVTKNTALAGFTFPMVLTSDHITAATGKTVTATRSIDGGAFGACANAVTEISNGWYKLDLAAADVNGNVIALRFTAAACDDTKVTIVTQP